MQIPWARPRANYTIKPIWLSLSIAVSDVRLLSSLRLDLGSCSTSGLTAQAGYVLQRKRQMMVVCGAKNLHGFNISNAQPRLPFFPSRPPKLVLVRAIMGTGGHFGILGVDPPQGRKRTVACTKPAFGVALPSQNTIMFTYFVPSLRLCVNLPGGTLVPSPSPFLRSHPCR